MPYINIKNPYDENKTPWVQIHNTDPKKSIEYEHVVDLSQVFSRLSRGVRLPAAGVIQATLNAAGFQVSTDQSMTPNGVTVSSAGILVAFDEEITDEDQQAVLFVIGEAIESTNIIEEQVAEPVVDAVYTEEELVRDAPEAEVI